MDGITDFGMVELKLAEMADKKAALIAARGTDGEKAAQVALMEVIQELNGMV